MALEISGKLFKLLAEQTGTGKNGTWTKRDFIVETSDQFPKKICFAAWGDKAEEVKNLPEGTNIKVSFDVNSREYNERWYTDLKAWKIEALGGAASPNTSSAPRNDAEPVLGESFTEASDDLPF